MTRLIPKAIDVGASAVFMALCTICGPASVRAITRSATPGSHLNEMFPLPTLLGVSQTLALRPPRHRIPPRLQRRLIVLRTAS
jgi:hypothetical protein